MRRTDELRAIERFLDAHKLLYRLEWRTKHPCVVISRNGRDVRVFFAGSGNAIFGKYYALRNLRRKLGLAGRGAP